MSLHLLTRHTQLVKASSAVASTVGTATAPIRNTAAYKVLADTVVDALDDSISSKYGGYEDKEIRRKRRQDRLLKAGRGSGLQVGGQRLQADPECVFLSFHSLENIF